MHRRASIYSGEIILMPPATQVSQARYTIIKKLGKRTQIQYQSL